MMPKSSQAKRIGQLVAAIAAWLLPIAVFAGEGPRAASKPNIIFVLIDDMGYGDLSCHGNPVLKTPNLDRLHREGARFTDFHVSPTCSATRAALMTGRHEFKSGVTHTEFERERLSLGAVTLAQVLKSAGYATGIFGKWHLGDEDAYQPGARGFDEVFIHGSGLIGGFHAGSGGDVAGNRYFDPIIRHNGRFVSTKGYCTDVFFREATKWMAGVKNARPFFAYVATNAPHSPLDCPPEYEKRYAGKVRPNEAKFFGMIANIDDNVGRLLAQLAEWGIERNTLVVFMNDNGGTEGVKVFNAKMRGQKATPWLGGTRAASFWRWPGTVTPGERVQLAAHVDLFPTLAALAGATLPREVATRLDGRSLVPALRDAAAPWQDRFLFTHLGRWERGKAAESKYRMCAVRWRQYHAVQEDKGPRFTWELFDVEGDPGETTDISAAHPDIVRRIDVAYDQWWSDILPCLENEDVPLAPVNAFNAAYRRQMGDLSERHH
jgi:arylsulfatase